MPPHFESLNHAASRRSSRFIGPDSRFVDALLGNYGSKETYKSGTKITNEFKGDAVALVSRQTALAMTHPLRQPAKNKWPKLDRQNRLIEIIEGIEFRDRIKH